MGLKLNKHTILNMVLLPLLLVSGLCTKLSAQSETMVFDSSVWKTLSEGHTYTEAKKKQENTVVRAPEDQKSDTTNAGWIWITVVCILFIASGILIYRLKQPDGKTKPGNTLLEFDIDTDLKWQLPSTALNKDSAGNPEQIFRLQYISILQLLAARGLIKYRRDKTNMDYQRELKGHVLHPQFSDLTLHFNQIHYGNAKLDPVLFNRLESVVMHMKNTLKQP